MRRPSQDRWFWCKHILYIPTQWILFSSLYLIKYTVFLDVLVLGGHSDIWYFSSWKCNFIWLYKMYSLDRYLTHRIYFAPENSWPSWIERVAQHVCSVMHQSFTISFGKHRPLRACWLGTWFIEDCDEGEWEWMLPQPPVEMEVIICLWTKDTSLLRGPDFQ